MALALPAPPIISVTQGSLQLCLGDSVQLGSSYSFGNLWNTNDTASQITVTDSGTFSLRHRDRNGCISSPSQSVTVQLNVPPAQPVISQIGSDTLIASISAQRYQWFLNDSLLTGLISREIKAPSSGTYKVIAYNDSCASDTSAAFQFVLTSLRSLELPGINVFPNPSDGVFILQMDQAINIQLQLFDMSGKLILEKRINQRFWQIDLGDQADGVYFLKTISDKGNRTYKLIKH
jgi:hypothetical protein